MAARRGADRAFLPRIASPSDPFETRTFISTGTPVDVFGVPDLATIDARPGSELHNLLICYARFIASAMREIVVCCCLSRWTAWWESGGASGTSSFFKRCCPLLLEVGAIAYWAMSTRQTPAMVRDTVEAVTQCVLSVDERSVRVVKAEGRDEGVRGSVLRWHEDQGRPVLAPAELIDRVATSLRAVRRARELSQQDLAHLAGVTASAISQAERAERGHRLERCATELGARGHDR